MHISGHAHTDPTATRRRGSPTARSSTPRADRSGRPPGERRRPTASRRRCRGGRAGLPRCRAPSPRPCKLSANTVKAYERQTTVYTAWLAGHAADHPDAFADLVGAEAAVTAWRRARLTGKAPRPPSTRPWPRPPSCTPRGRSYASTSTASDRRARRTRRAHPRPAGQGRAGRCPCSRGAVSIPAGYRSGWPPVRSAFTAPAASDARAARSQHRSGPAAAVALRAASSNPPSVPDPAAPGGCRGVGSWTSGLSRSAEAPY